MNRLSDQELLADYAQRHTEAAFAELVRRHIDLVHSAAWRMVRDAHLAEDVTQSAFLALAHNATRLLDRPVLSGWLHGTAQNLAANAVRSAVRRRAREQEAAAMNELLAASPDPTWEQIAPHLDAALGELSEPDRDAVLLRYFQKKSAQEMAAVLGVSAEAAQKRVSRAVERLREIFAQRGVAVGASGLVVLLSAHAVQAAPAGLAITIATAATLAGTLASTATATATATVPATATKAITMTLLQKTLVTATVAVLAGAGIYEARQNARLRDQVASLEQQQAPLAQQIEQLQHEHDTASNRLAALRAEQQQAPDQTAELLRLRGMAGVARRAIAEAEQLRAQLAASQSSEPATSPVLGAMADAMQQGVARQFDGRLSRMTASLQLTPEQAQAAREILMRQARAMSVGMQQAMSGKFDKAELTREAEKAGNTDQQIKALLTPEQRAAFPAYEREEAALTASLSANQQLVQMQLALGLSAEQMDRAYAALYEVTFKQLTENPRRKFANEGEAMQWTEEQKAKALEPILSENQLQTYRQQQAVQAKLVKDIMQKMETSGGAK